MNPRDAAPEARDARSPWSRFVAAIRADHATLQRYDEKYAAGSRPPSSLTSDIASRIGLQMMACLRLVRLCRDAGVPLAPKVLTRAIRHLYGSDIHWDAQIDDGVVLVHGMGIAMSHAARVRSGAILSQNVTIGDGVDPVTRELGAPDVGEDVHIGAGATLIGPITVGAGSKIMPGVVLARSVPPNSLVEAPTPNVKPRGGGAAPRAEP